MPGDRAAHRGRRHQPADIVRVALLVIDLDRAAAALTDLPVAVRSRVLLAAARESGSPSNDLTHEHVVELDRLVTDWNGQGPVHLPGRVIAGRRYGRLYFVGANGDSAHSSGIGAADGS